MEGICLKEVVLGKIEMGEQGEVWLRYILYMYESFED